MFIINKMILKASFILIYTTFDLSADSMPFTVLESLFAVAETVGKGSRQLFLHLEVKNSNIMNKQGEKF